MLLDKNTERALDTILASMAGARKRVPIHPAQPGVAAPVKGQKRRNKDRFNEWYKRMTGRGPAKTLKG